MKWQPIETAPRDGTSLLLWCPHYKRPIRVGTYEIWEDFSHGQSVSKREYWSIGTFDSLEVLPTHWMPLPEPPA